MHSSSPVLGTKLCKKCLSENPLSEFYKSKNGLTRARCKKCHNAETLAWKHANPLENAEMSRRFYEKHIDWHKKSMLGWRNKIKDTKPWLFSYYAAKQRCVNPNNKKFHLYGGKGVKFLLSKRDVEYIWDRDKASLQSRPSIDRKDSNGHYEISNCRFIELSENSSLGAYSRINSQGHF